MSVDDFFARGKSCGDPSHFCTVTKGTSKDGYDQTTYAFDQQQWSSTISAGYFCIFSQENESNYYYSLVLPTSKVAKVEFNQNYTKEEHDGTNYYRDYMSDATLQSLAGEGEVLMQTNYEFQVGYINSQTRKVSGLSSFELVVKKVNYWYYLMWLRRNHPVIFTFMILFVLLFYSCIFCGKCCWKYASKKWTELRARRQNRGEEKEEDLEVTESLHSKGVN